MYSLGSRAKETAKETDSAWRGASLDALDTLCYTIERYLRDNIERH